jgi:hypothetical protein
MDFPFAEANPGRKPRRGKQLKKYSKKCGDEFNQLLNFSG